MIMGDCFCILSSLLNFICEHNTIYTIIVYHLAPKHPYPALIEDCYAGLVWVHKHTEELRINLTCIMINGLLAGAGLADRNANIAGWNVYLGDCKGSDDVSIYAAPIRATNLTGLPPAYIDIRSTEIFRNEDVQYAQNMWSDGMQSQLSIMARKVRLDWLRRILFI
ncbi:uncharacterized protein P174DRAFT_461939 [Aspergillus novofumigatus IBT 16806]|uniref:Alpha/beta hydrolase fold-3 domain-containing protein n=1 Tax=Aspergillus novofumigatus (strain IBT 16806) TaxID=1392255 RepID=A0A2I1C169_ASPN1|nr:uncharacterized protein P174DRAFT_461939 [Aspergillus novofumigatus IBT 16806]PKX91345.1 hypothetical protein P174DRAFT_461939 [Aspergillus novofumigatus IBT 16806]